MVELSLITPVVHGEAYIADNVRAILAALETAGRPFEVIVVCDGSADATPALAAVDGDPRVQVLHYDENQGKGYAICSGIAVARGRYVGWLDADLDISADAIVAAWDAIASGDADAVIGSKRHPDSVVSYPLVRRLLSAGYQVLVRLLLRVDVRDTQTGAKVFRREMLDVVAPLLLIKRYAFDLEVLAVGAEFGFDRVQEIPIVLDYRFTGTGIGNRAVRHMFVDTLAIAYRIHLRHWYVRQFAALQRVRGDLLRAGDADLPAAPTSTLSQIRDRR